MTFSEWVNKTQMVSFGAFMNQIYFGIPLTAFTLTSCVLMLRGADSGLALAGIAAGMVTTKVGINAAANHGIRKTSREYMRDKVEVMKAETAEHEALNAVRNPLPATH